MKNFTVLSSPNFGCGPKSKAQNKIYCHCLSFDSHTAKLVVTYSAIFLGPINSETWAWVEDRNRMGKAEIPPSPCYSLLVSQLPAQACIPSNQCLSNSNYQRQAGIYFPMGAKLPLDRSKKFWCAIAQLGDYR